MNESRVDSPPTLSHIEASAKLRVTGEEITELISLAHKTGAPEPQILNAALNTYQQFGGLKTFKDGVLSFYSHSDLELPIKFQLKKIISL